MISEQRELLTLSVSAKVLHTPDGSLHLQQESCVVTLMFL